MPDEKPLPTTPSGRAVSALNRLTHGGPSQSLFLKDEDPGECFALLEDAFEYHQTTNSQDSGLVTDKVLARWFVLRRQEMRIDNEAELHNRKPQVTYWVEPDLKNIELLDRYKSQAERALTRALNNVRHIRKEALAESHWQSGASHQSDPRIHLRRPRSARASLVEHYGGHRIHRVVCVLRRRRYLCASIPRHRQKANMSLTFQIRVHPRSSAANVRLPFPFESQNTPFLRLLPVPQFFSPRSNRKMRHLFASFATLYLFRPVRVLALLSKLVKKVLCDD